MGRIAPRIAQRIPHVHPYGAIFILINISIECVFMYKWYIIYSFILGNALIRLFLMAINAGWFRLCFSWVTQVFGL